MSLLGGHQPAEATSSKLEIASGENQERPRNDISIGEKIVFIYKTYLCTR